MVGVMHEADNVYSDQMVRQMRVEIAINVVKASKLVQMKLIT